MGLDLRYHIVSLVAVFIALGTGILVGVGLSSPPSIEKWRLHVEKQFKAFRKENQSLQKQKAEGDRVQEYDQRFLKSVLPLLVQQRLKGVRVAILQTADPNDASFKDQLDATLKEAGALVASVTRLRPEFEMMAPELQTKLMARLMLQTPEESKPLSRLAEAVAQRVALGDPENRLSVFSGSRLLDLDGDYEKPAGGVIVLGGADGRSETGPETVDLPMLHVLVTQRVNVVACELSAAGRSAMPVYQREHVATVDNVDMLAGQVALVYALSGAVANYGLKKTADMVMPAIQMK